jgi:hypothetical protein
MSSVTIRTMLGREVAPVVGEFAAARATFVAIVTALIRIIAERNVTRSE